MEHNIDLENEIWLTWKDTRYNPAGHLYEVSNQGRAKKDGEIVDYGYHGLKYYGLGGDYLHRIIAKLFVPNPENKPCVDHINGDKHDNRACNLRWVTYKENMNNPSTLNSRKGKKLKEETRLKMFGNKNGVGNKGPTGLIWIHLGNKSKFVHKDYLDYWLDDGWIYGRGKLKKNKSTN